MLVEEEQRDWFNGSRVCLFFSETKEHDSGTPSTPGENTKAVKENAPSSL